MAEKAISKPPQLEEDSSASYESPEETLPQHDLDTSASLKIICSKRNDSSETELAKSPVTLDNLRSTDKTLAKEKVKEEKRAVEDAKEGMSPGKKKLYSWLNKHMKIEMTDGRVLVGVFLCTDRDANVILGSCTEYLNPEVCGFSDEPRILGLVMVPGRHIVSIHHDASDGQLMMMPEEKELVQKDFHDTYESSH